MNSAEAYIERAMTQLLRIPELLYFGILLERRTSNILQAQPLQKKKRRYISTSEHQISLEFSLYFEEKEPVFFSKHQYQCAQNSPPSQDVGSYV